jgi:hypothetical protein
MLLVRPHSYGSIFLGALSLQGSGVPGEGAPVPSAGRVCGSTAADSPPNRIKMFCLSATHIAMVKITGEAAKRAAHALPAASQPAHNNTAGTDVGLKILKTAGRVCGNTAADSPQ